MKNRELIEPYTVAGEWSHLLEDGRVQCDLCPRYCKLHEDQRGFCYIRQEKDGQVVLTSYGRASGFCIDPIEKKPLNHFFPGSSVLSFGTAGCNLGCKFCQNWDISKARETNRLTDHAKPEEIARAAAVSGCKSIAFTYNDPVIFAEYAIDCAEAAHDLGLKTVAVTAGYISPKAQEQFYRNMDAANVDLKGFTEDFYQKLCFAELQPVIETLSWIKKETSTWLEVTTLLIPGYNDSPHEIDDLCSWYLDALGSDVPLHFTAFHPDFKMMDVPPTPPATIKRARQQALKAGIHFVYTGNIWDTTGGSTYCANCHALLIERSWYELGTWALDTSGNCRACGTHLPGHFDPRPGDWGSRRAPIRISSG